MVPYSRPMPVNVTDGHSSRTAWSMTPVSAADVDEPSKYDVTSAPNVARVRATEAASPVPT